MGPSGNQSERNRAQYTFNLTLAAVIGQVGCLTLLIVLAALFGGLWLDNRFDTRPILTVVLTVASVPITIVMMFWVANKATSRMKNAQKNIEKPQEEAQGGKIE